VSNIGTAISYLALIFFVYDLTESPMAMAILAMAQTIPNVAFAGHVGVYVDRWDRKKIMVVSDIIRAGIILLIPLSIHLSSIMPTVYWVYLLTFIYASANAWFFPARNAAIPNIVGNEDLVPANSLSQMTFQVVQLVVPPLGGILVALLAPDYFMAFALNSATFIFSAIALRSIQTNLVPDRSNLSTDSFLSQVIEGGKCIISNSVLSFLMVFAMLLAWSSGILNALLLPYLEGELAFGSAQVGLIMSAGAATGAVTALYLGRKKELDYPLFLIAGAGLIAGVAVAALVAASNLPGVILSWGLIGCVDVLFVIPLNTLLQKLVEDELRGRVFALEGVAFTSVQVVGMGIGGVWAEVIGSTVIPLLGASIGLVVLSLLGFGAITYLKLHARIQHMSADRVQDLEPPELTSEVTA
jgi:MFS family permease